MLAEHKDMMERLPHYREKYEAAKRTNVYFIPGHDDETQQPVFYYAICSALLHEQMMDCLKSGIIPHFAVIIEKGVGAPSRDIKAKIKEHYGFDHDKPSQ